MTSNQEILIHFLTIAFTSQVANPISRISLAVVHVTSITIDYLS